MNSQRLTPRQWVLVNSLCEGLIEALGPEHSLSQRLDLLLPKVRQMDNSTTVDNLLALRQEFPDELPQGFWNQFNRLLTVPEPVINEASLLDMIDDHRAQQAAGVTIAVEEFPVDDDSEMTTVFIPIPLGPDEDREEDGAEVEDIPEDNDDEDTEDHTSTGEGETEMTEEELSDLIERISQNLRVFAGMTGRNDLRSMASGIQTRNPQACLDAIEVLEQYAEELGQHEDDRVSLGYATTLERLEELAEVFYVAGEEDADDQDDHIRGGTTDEPPTFSGDEEEEIPSWEDVILTRAPWLENDEGRLSRGLIIGAVAVLLVICIGIPVGVAVFGSSRTTTEPVPPAMPGQAIMPENFGGIDTAPTPTPEGLIIPAPPAEEDLTPVDVDEFVVADPTCVHIPEEVSKYIGKEAPLRLMNLSGCYNLSPRSDQSVALLPESRYGLSNPHIGETWVRTSQIQYASWDWPIGSKISVGGCEGTVIDRGPNEMDYLAGFAIVTNEAGAVCLSGLSTGFPGSYTESVQLIRLP